ncbi:hypothetical protein Tdes44962_MAKER03357 [Teratosphaeria destructans]|uniref:Uncharacterized protein n=1 Tax=Teratosphaeria destructans TaxID=418781 RepID=A0A9W7SQ31_9PEZI|nr:hypothetical protein Tdes44962_MAKER03357 [Teratosphaeria destructans]
MSATTTATAATPNLRHDRTGFTDSTTTSTTSSSADKYQLDEFDDRPILLYKYRGQLRTSSQKDLCAWLDKGIIPLPAHASQEQRARELSIADHAPADEKLRCTRKRIPRGASYVDVRRHDLYLPDEKGTYSHLPNYESSLASIKVPFLAYLSNLIFGRYEDLYIVSPESSPASSLADGDSRRSSPTSNWGENSEEDATTGAKHESMSRG